MNKELTWGLNDDKSRLGLFCALHVARVGPTVSSCKIRKQKYLQTTILSLLFVTINVWHLPQHDHSTCLLISIR